MKVWKKVLDSFLPSQSSVPMHGENHRNSWEEIVAYQSEM